MLLVHAAAATHGYQNRSYFQQPLIERHSQQGRMPADGMIPSCRKGIDRESMPTAMMEMSALASVLRVMYALKGIFPGTTGSECSSSTCPWAKRELSSIEVTSEREAMALFPFRDSPLLASASHPP